MTTNTRKVLWRRDWTCQSQVSDVLKEVPSQSDMSEQFYGYFAYPGSSRLPNSHALFRWARLHWDWAAGNQLTHPQLRPSPLAGHNKELLVILFSHTSTFLHMVLRLCITRFNIHIFYIMPTEQYLYVLYTFQSK